MVNKTIEHTTADGKEKLKITLDVLDKSFIAIKLYRKDEETYDQAYEKAKDALRNMVSDAFPEGVNRRVKYLINEQLTEEAEKVRQEN